MREGGDMNTNDFKKLVSVTAKNDPVHLGLADGVLWSIGDGKTFFRYAEKGPQVKVDSKEFIKLIRLLPKDVDIEMGDGFIKMNGSEFHFHTEPIPSSIALSPLSPSDLIHIDAKQLAKAVKFNACASDDARLGLRMILYDHGTMVSTDGYRMHIIEGERTDHYFKFPPSPVLPAMGGEISVTHQNKATIWQDRVTVWVSDIGQVEFEALDDYKFPSWQDVIPTYPFSGPSVDATLLTKIVEMTRGKNKFVKLRGDMTVLGEENITVPHQGDNLPGTVQLHSQFLKDALGLFTTPTITWKEMKDRSDIAPVLIREKERTAIIMPCAYLE